MTAAARIDTTLIAGLGLIGGSLARVLRARGFSRRVIGYGHREPSLARGVELGVIDSYHLNLAAALAEAELVVIATPTLVAEDMLERILPQLRATGSRAVVTDVASVKGNLQRCAERLWGSMPPRLVLGHPIAGSEQSGVESSREELFVDHRVILTPAPDNDADAVQLVRDMWACTGAEVVDMAVADHDAVLAATSHLPHMLAYALVDALAQSPVSTDIFRFAAGGFRDFTRIASSDPVMWRDIAIANRAAVLAAMDQFSAHLALLRQAVEREDGDEMLQVFSRAKVARDDFAAKLAARRRGD
ncbi:MAG: prephenate dehydrogenase/arogenate dehydrogenase family protein [Parahaliea sp.]